MARPPAALAKINVDELKKLLRLYPSRKETADWFEVSEKTLERFIEKEFSDVGVEGEEAESVTFEELRDRYFVHTKINIKRVQIEKALKGDNTMLIWLGKQMLGQRDKSSHELSGPDGKPIETKKTDLTDEQLDAQIAAMLANGSHDAGLKQG